MLLKSIVISILIHILTLGLFLSLIRNSPPRSDVIEIAIADESSLTLPIEELPEISIKPKQPTKPKAIEAVPAIPMAAAVETESAQDHHEIQKENLPLTQAAGAPIAVAEPIANGNGTGIGGNSGIGNGVGGSPAVIGNFGDDKTDQGAGGNSNIVSFGSPTGPRFLQRKMPEYPFAARRQKKEGKVILAITIDASGRLQHVEVMEASDPLFVSPSIAALKKSSFLPAIRNGTPITVKAILPIRFAITDGHEE
jgi:protein TonB